MTILVTGATGRLGRLTIAALLDRGTPASQVAALVRDPAKASDLADRGVDIRVGSYDDPASLEVAVKGVDRVLLVSGTDLGRRTAQHQNVIDAAARAGVSLIAYTSAPHADTSPLALAKEHWETEQAIAASGLPSVVLRNGWYFENQTAQIATQVEHGVVLGAAGDGRLSAAARADYAEAAAVVLTEDGHAGQVYELGGDTSFAMADYAAEVATASGRPVEYRDLTPADFAAALVSAGVPETFAEVLADNDAGLKDGALLVETGDLSRLIGHPTTSLQDAVRGALA